MPPRLGRCIAAAVVVVATVVLVVAPSTGSAASAASPHAAAPRAAADPAGPAFDCTEPTWFLAQGQTYTGLWAGTFRDDGSAVIAPLGPTSPQYNAIGFDPDDDYIYGILNPAGVTVSPPGAASNDLLQIDSTGAVTNLGPIANLPPGQRNNGAFDPAGSFWVTTATAASAATTLWEISIATRSVIHTETLTGAPYHASDFAYADGYMWGLEGRTLYRIDLGTGVVTAFPNAVTVDTLTYGAAWTFGNGNLGFSNNDTGHIFQIAVANPSSPTPTFTLVGAPYQGPRSGNNDGTSCIPKPVDLGIVKSGPQWVAEGGTITWTLTVTNHGPGNSGGYAVSDMVPPGVTNVRQVVTNPGDTAACDVTGNPVQCSLGALAHGDSFTITLAGTVTAAAGSCLTNTATVTGMEDDPNPLNDSSNWTACVLGVRLQKSPDITSFDAPNTPITYTYTISNPNDVPLTLVSLTDDPLGPISCTDNVIPPDSSIVCTKQHSTTQQDVDAGGISNVATVRALGPDDVEVTAQANAHVPASQSPGISLVKTADVTSFDAANTEISYSYTVENTGNVTLDPVTVTDELPDLSGLDCDPANGSPLAPKQTMTCTASYFTTQPDVDAGGVTNAATATGQPPSGAAVKAQASVTVPATRSPGISLVKTGTPPAYSQAGELITYGYLVRNTGNVTLDPVNVIDSRLGAISTCPSSSLPPGPDGFMICQVTYQVTQADVDRGFVANVATVTGQPPAGAGPPVRDRSAAVVRLVHQPEIGLAKQADVSGYDAPGTTIHYTFTVTNDGNVTLHLIRLADSRLGQITCPRTSLPPGPDGAMTCTATYTTTQADVDAGEIRNTATVTGISPHGRIVSAAASAVVTAAQEPAISITKTARPVVFAAAGTRLVYRYRVANIGNVTLDPVTVTDSRGIPVSCPGVSLAPGAAMTCTATHPTTQQELEAGGISNIGTATGTAPNLDRVQATDPLRVPGLQIPAIRVVKTADPTSFTRPGVRITYSYRITNIGNVTLNSVSLTDNLLGPVTVCSATSLAPGASLTCTGTAITTQTDLDHGSIVNTATATGIGPRGQRVIGRARATVTGVQNPAIRLIKTATYTRFEAAGTRITYIYLVVNTGNVTLSQINLHDSRLGQITCPPPGRLAPRQLTVCTATYTTTQADVDGTGITNTGTATGTAPDGRTVSDDSTLTVRPVHKPAITVAKTASVPSFAAAGTPITYRYVVTNTGNATLRPVTVTDSRLGSILCPTNALAPGASMICSRATTTTTADLDAGGITNTGTATGTAPDGSTVDDTSTITVPAEQGPAIGILKLARPGRFSAPGTTIRYRYLVTNAGNVTLDPVDVTDGTGIPVDCPETSLAAGEQMICTATHGTTQTDVDNGGVTNTGIATGTAPDGSKVDDTSTVTVRAVQQPAISLKKTADTASFSAAGTPISYTYLVTNTGNVTLSPVVVNDPLPGLSTVHCPGPSVGPTLAPGQSVTCTASYTTTRTDLDNGRIVNTGLAAGAAPDGATVSDQSTATVTGTQQPAIMVVKTVSPARFDRSGTLIHYSYRVTNTGNVTLTPVAVTDDRLGAITCPTDTPPVLTLAPGASVTCTARYTTTTADVHDGSIGNTGTATGIAPDGTTVQHTDSATVAAIQRPAISIVKSATVSAFDRPGTRIGYTYQVTNTGNVTLTNVTVSDPHPGLSRIVCATSTLPPGATMTCTASYATTQADVDRGRLTNTGTAAGTAPNRTRVTANDTRAINPLRGPAIGLVKTASVTRFSAAGTTITYHYLATNLGNVTLEPVTVTDNLPGLSPISCPARRLAPRASMTCTAHYTTSQADLQRGQILNTGLAAGGAPNGVTVKARTPLITVGPATAPAPLTAPGSIASTGLPPWLIWLICLAAAAITAGLAALTITRRRAHP